MANSDRFNGGRHYALIPDRLTSLLVTVTRNESFYRRKGTRRNCEAVDRGTRSDSGIQTLRARTVWLICSRLFEIITDEADHRVELEREQ
jgi:hypothetical protein